MPKVQRFLESSFDTFFIINAFQLPPRTPIEHLDK